MKQGAQKIVLDLRDTAGGSLTEAVAVATEAAAKATQQEDDENDDKYKSN